MQYLFATSNKNKIKEASKILERDIESVDIDLIEIQSLDAVEVIKHKAKEAFDFFQKATIVEDTSLSISAWNGLPGPLIKWFMKSVGNQGLLEMMLNFSNRSAVATVHVAIYDGNDYFVGAGSVTGVISSKEKGNNGFGWDTLFLPDGSTKTFAEMEPEEKNQISMRKLAFFDFAKKIS